VWGQGAATAFFRAPEQRAYLNSFLQGVAEPALAAH
jgi:hypothetical protein